MNIRIFLGMIFLAVTAVPSFVSAGGYAEALLADVNGRISNINTQTLRAQLEKEPDTILIDVRTPDEVLLRGGLIDAPRTYNIPLGWLVFRIEERAPDRDAPIVVYCGANQRSPLAAARLMDMGYTRVSNYADGLFAWRDAQLPREQPDEALDSILFSKPVQVTEGVWTAVGATEPQTYENSGHNNNLTMIETDDGLVLVNAAGNYLLAKAWHEEIKKISAQPVRYVIFENGQTHAAFGAAYWKEQGATLIAHADAVHELEAYGEEGLERVRRLQRDKAIGVRVVMPDETFKDKKVMELGGVRIELLHLGPAHSPGDISVWLPQKKTVIAGDIAFHQRLLAVFEHTDAKGWIETWEHFAALEPEIVVPGHGAPTTLDVVTRWTRDYLLHLRAEIGALLEEGAGLNEAGDIDQSAYRHLDTFEQLARLNAAVVFRQMEFE